MTPPKVNLGDAIARRLARTELSFPEIVAEAERLRRTGFTPREIVHAMNVQDERLRRAWREGRAATSRGHLSGRPALRARRTRKITRGRPLRPALDPSRPPRSEPEDRP